MGADLVRAALAGGIASSTSTLVLHPLDTLKTRIQARLYGCCPLIWHQPQGARTLVPDGFVA